MSGMAAIDQAKAMYLAELALEFVKGHLKPGGDLQASWIPTPLGDMIAVSSRTHLHLLEFIDRKALPKELARLTAGSRIRLGIGRPEATAQAAEELRAFFAGTRSCSGRVGW